MTKGLTGRASQNLNVAASYKQSYDCGWTTYYPIEKIWNKHWKGLFPFSTRILRNPLSTVISSRLPLPGISTSTNNLYTDIVKGIVGKPTLTVKVKVESSDRDSICSDITQNYVTLKTCNTETIQAVIIVTIYNPEIMVASQWLMIGKGINIFDWCIPCARKFENHS